MRVLCVLFNLLYFKVPWSMIMFKVFFIKIRFHNPVIFLE